MLITVVIESKEGASPVKKMIENIKMIVEELRKDIDVYLTIQRYVHNTRKLKSS